MEKIRLSIATTDKLGKPEYQYQNFYRADEVDARLTAKQKDIDDMIAINRDLIKERNALLADVAKLVEAAKDINESFEELWYDLHVEQVKRFEKAIAAVERHLEAK